jgi:hypothetical protein
VLRLSVPVASVPVQTLSASPVPNGTAARRPGNDQNGSSGSTPTATKRSVR